MLGLLVEGLPNEEIAQTMHLSQATVKKHLGSIMAKLHLRNRVQVAVFGVRRGIGMLVIARWRVVALVIATLFVTAVAAGWLSALWL